MNADDPETEFTNARPRQARGATIGSNGTDADHRHCTAPDLRRLPREGWRAAVTHYLAGYRTSVAPQTERAYRQALASGRTPERADCRATYGVRRAAALQRARNALRAWLRGANLQADLWCAEIRRLEALRWSEIKRGRGPDDASWERRRRRRQKSRKALSRLPRGWKRQTFASATRPLKPILAVLELAGARPAEFARGRGVAVSADRQPDGSWLFGFRIVGAKVSRGGGGKIKGDRGQADRTLTVVAPDSPPARLLGNLVAEHGQPYFARGRARSITNRVVLLARRLWPRLKTMPRPSAYSYRHEFAAGLKRGNATKSQIAQAMGHVSTRTQAGYGASHGGHVSPTVLVFATADLEPRLVPRPPPAHRRVRADDEQKPERVALRP